jgi:Rnl2 family RNA ligase
MIFRKYNEIENTYRTDFIQKIKNLNLDPNTQFACFNKVDGSNFSIILDEDDNFACAKRTDIVTPAEKFHNCDYVIEKMDLIEKIKEIKKYVMNKFDITNMYNTNKCSVQIYGELCGGMYRHSDVEKVKGAVKIQGRVSYHPDNIWIPFDGFVEIDENRIIYFNVDELAEICKHVDLPCQVEKFRGTLDECLNFDVQFVDDTGHVLFGLPLIDGNLSEGVVIKPVYPMWFPNGERIILKNKNERFKEKVKKEKIQKVEDPLNENELNVLNILNTYATESRMYSIFSKEGNLNDKLFGKVLGLYILDCLNDAIKENPKIQDLININDKEIFDYKRVKKNFQEYIVKNLRVKFIEYLTTTI